MSISVFATFSDQGTIKTRDHRSNTRCTVPTRTHKIIASFSWYARGVQYPRGTIQVPSQSTTLKLLLINLIRLSSQPVKTTFWMISVFWPFGDSFGRFAGLRPLFGLVLGCLFGVLACVFPFSQNRSVDRLVSLIHSAPGLVLIRAMVRSSAVLSPLSLFCFCCLSCFLSFCFAAFLTSGPKAVPWLYCIPASLNR